MRELMLEYVNLFFFSVFLVEEKLYDYFTHGKIVMIFNGAGDEIYANIIKMTIETIHINIYLSSI